MGLLIYSIVERQGYDGLVLATMMAGLIMIAVGFMRWGTYIKGTSNNDEFFVGLIAGASRR
jgi:MFS superfamily sulfate permease-like transporter